MSYPNIDTLMLHTLTMIIQRHKDFCDFQKNRKEYKDTTELTCMMDWIFEIQVTEILH